MSCEVHCTFIMYFGAVHLSYVPSSHVLQMLLWECQGAVRLDMRKLQSFGANTVPFPARAKRGTGRNKREPPPVLGLFLALVKQVPTTRPSEAFCHWCLRNARNAHGLSNMHSAFEAAQRADGNALRAIDTTPR